MKALRHLGLCIIVNVGIATVLGVAGVMIANPLNFTWAIVCRYTMAVFCFGLVPAAIVAAEQRLARPANKYLFSMCIGLSYTAPLCGSFVLFWLLLGGTFAKYLELWPYAFCGILLGPVALLFNELLARCVGRTPSEEPFEPMCESCGYSLRGLSVARCPECGASFDASILGAEKGISP